MINHSRLKGLGCNLPGSAIGTDAFFSAFNRNYGLIPGSSTPQKLQMQTKMRKAKQGVGGSWFVADGMGISLFCGSTKIRLFCNASSVREKAAADVDGASNFYQILGLSQNVALPDIKAAYRHMARRYHPDVCPPEEAEKCTRFFIAVQEAYETLSDPRQKALYDTALSKPSYSSKTWSREEEDYSSWKQRWEDQLAVLKKRSAAKAQQEFSESWGCKNA